MHKNIITSKVLSVFALSAIIVGSLAGLAPTTFAITSVSAATTNPATAITSGDAILNGTNGSSDASGHSFWVSTSTFSTASPTVPDGVFSTADFGAIASSTAFGATLSSITGIGAITASTTYYFAAWSSVDGTWIPGAVLNLTTLGTTTSTQVVNLLSESNFTILSETGITDTGSHTSAITGNIGSSPITSASIGVFCPEISGKIYGVDAAYVGNGDQTCFISNPPLSNKTIVDNAIGDMVLDYNNLAGRTNPTATELGAGNIGGMTLAPGLYKWSSDVTIPTNVTLSGNANDVWVFQIAGNLDIASAGSVPAGVKVLLAGGAKASNIYWQVGGLTGATLGTYSTFNGTILAAKQVILDTGAVLNGRSLAQTQVTLDASTVSNLDNNGIIDGTVTGGAHTAGILSVTGLTAVKTSAIANATFADGWKYVFNITVPTTEKNLSMKFGDWANGSSTLSAANNMRISSAQADNSGATVLVTGANTYTLPTLHMTGDLDPTTDGNQVQITVEVAIPSSTVNGAYTTSYGIRTN